MKNTFGNALTVTLFGESHGEAIGAVIDGMAPGVRVDIGYINEKLALRRPHGPISTKRVEGDEFELLSGVFEGHTTGTPICITIKNGNSRSNDYSSLLTKPRPSHADYTAACKYHGYQDYRGGGHFSGRVTAALVAAGAIVQSALEAKGITLGTHIKYLGGISDREIDGTADLKLLSEKVFPVLSDEAAESMREKIVDTAREGDSIGGILETMVAGIPSGVGEPWFDSVESQLSHALFSVPAIKGVEFGLGFGFANAKGSEANDAFEINDGAIKTKTNNNGGINGGITNGMPIVFRCAVKPTPSIYKEQDTVDLSSMENVRLLINGRHDPAIIHRARAVVDAVCALTLADMLTVRYGTDYLMSE